MAEPRRTQKQISERYQGNLTYYSGRRWWRRAQFLASAVVVAAVVAAIIFYERRGPQEFFTAGPISSVHASFGNDCGQCHDPRLTSSGPLTVERFRQVLDDRFHHGIPLQPLDAKCETCHQQHALHEPNVVENRSCSVCHQEHKGATSLGVVASLECAACHADAHVMQASAAKGAGMPASAFRIRPTRPTQVVFESPRPQSGYTKTIASFWTDHPDFQLKRDGARDPNMLRFNHQRHFAADIPLLNGQKLDCTSCHQADAEGRYVKRISFAANCQACHALQFDANNPELVLPHGNADAVHAYLRTLPSQYGELAVKRGIVEPKKVQLFVVQQFVQLRNAHRSVEDIERDAFFTDSPYRRDSSVPGRARGSFYGCAFCHEVKSSAAAVPTITKPVLIDRWLPHGSFNHAKHTSIKCDDCHHATQSHDTSDILLPAKATCVACHSPPGKVASECITCHTYHAPPQIAAVAAGSTLKDMLRAGTRGSR